MTEFLEVPVWMWAVTFGCMFAIYRTRLFLDKRRELSRERELEEWRDALHHLKMNQLFELQYLRDRCRAEHGNHVEKLRAKIESTNNPQEVAVLQLSLDAIRDKVNDRHTEMKLKHDLQHNDLRAKHYRVLGHGL